MFEVFELTNGIFFTMPIEWISAQTLYCEEKYSQIMIYCSFFDFETER